MEQPVLTCDIGNTNIKLGLFLHGKISTTWILPSNLPMTADSLGMQIRGLLGYNGTGRMAFLGCIAVSVVPRLNMILQEAIEKYIGCSCWFVPQDIPVPLDNHYARPEEVGADRLVAAWAARRLHPEPQSLIVVDFGTAVTFDCVEANRYLGGLIFPGPAAAASVLATQTAKLPHIGFGRIPDKLAPCRDTATSIQHGLLYGYVALTEGICARLRLELPEPAMTVGTGSFASILNQLSSIFEEVRPDLLLGGLGRLLMEQRAFSGS